MVMNIFKENIFTKEEINLIKEITGQLPKNTYKSRSKVNNILIPTDK